MKVYESKQEVFDTAFAGLKSQGFKKSYSDLDKSCVYLNPDNGCKCAVGHLLSDTVLGILINNEMNTGTNVAELVETIPEVDIAFRATYNEVREISNMEFLEELQSIHDCSADPEQMRVDLLTFAEDYELDWPEGELR